MKNLLVTLITWGSAGGPFPRRIRWLAEGLVTKGRKVDIIFLKDPKGVRHVRDRIREIGLGTRASKAIPSLFTYFRNNRPRLTIATPAHIVPPALIAARLSGVPIVPQEVTLLSYDIPFLPYGMRYVMPFLRKVLYKWASAVAAVSSDVAKEVGKELKIKPVFVLPNPCQPEVIRAAAECPRPVKKQRFCKLITVGRLIHQKGVDIVLKALSMLENSGVSAWQLEVLGDGPMRQHYQRMVVELGLEDRVKFLGYVPNPYPYMAQSDLFVHAARWEGFGMVIVEALALGLPVIATSCPGGPKEILDHGRYGRLVPPENVEALAETIAELIEDATERQKLSIVARERSEHYRPERIAEKVLEIEQYVWSTRQSKD